MYIVVSDKIVPRSRVSNCYFLDMRFMHGDGDHYTTESYCARLDNPSELEFLHQLMECCDLVQELNPSYLESRVQYMRAHRNGQLGDVDEDTINYFVDCAPSDLTNEQFLATFDCWAVRYFDENGIEYTTKITKVEV